MSDFNRMVYKYTIQESSKIKSICEPIQRYFGVNHFWYSKTTPDGRYFSLASNPEMHDYYHSSKFHLHSPFFRKPDLIPPGLYYYPSIADPKFQETIDLTASKVNVALGAGFVMRQGSELIRFGYAIHPKASCNIVDVIFNNFELLLKFNDYFVKEAHDIIKKAERDPVDLTKEMGKVYYQAPSGMNALLTPSAKGKFLESIGCLQRASRVKLSQREKECLGYLLDGFTARHIADHLGISKRTVETHLESAKNKLGCYCKEELFQRARLLKISGELCKV